MLIHTTSIQLCPGVIGSNQCQKGGGGGIIQIGKYLKFKILEQYKKYEMFRDKSDEKTAGPVYPKPKSTSERKI